LWNRELMCFSTARSVRNSDLAIAVGELRERGVCHPVLGRDERLDHLGIQHRTTLGHLVDGSDELLEVGDALLQQVPEPRRPVLQQLVGVGLLGELRQHDDADIRVIGPDAPGGVDAFGRVRGRHPDVGEDDVGFELLDRGHQLVERARGADQLDLIGRLEQRRGPLPHQVVILREDHAHHARIVPSSERQVA
jgi:hypothetical protein